MWLEKRGVHGKRGASDFTMACTWVWNVVRASTVKARKGSFWAHCDGIKCSVIAVFDSEFISLGNWTIKTPEIAACAVVPQRSRTRCASWRNMFCHGRLTRLVTQVILINVCEGKFNAKNEMAKRRNITQTAMGANVYLGDSNGVTTTTSFCAAFAVALHSSGITKIIMPAFKW